VTSSKPTTCYQDIRHNVAKIRDYLARGGGLGNVLSGQSMACDAIRMCFLEISEAAVAYDTREQADCWPAQAHH
jgi:hypothetical protein